MKKFYRIFTFALFSLLIVHCTLIIENCMSQWQQTNGPSGGSVNVLLVKGDTLYAGICGGYGGLYFSTNNGVSGKISARHLFSVL